MFWKEAKKTCVDTGSRGNGKKQRRGRHKTGFSHRPNFRHLSARRNDWAKVDGNNGMDTWHCTRIKSRFFPSPSQASKWRTRREWELGLSSGALVSPIFDMMWDVVLRKIRRTDAVALTMLRSQSFSADGGNQKPGIGGKRVMHALCSCGMAWHSGIHGRAPKTDRLDWAHGGLAHRSLALTVVQQSQWRGLDWCVCAVELRMERMHLERRGATCSSQLHSKQRCRRSNSCK